MKYPDVDVVDCEGKRKNMNESSRTMQQLKPSLTEIIALVKGLLYDVDDNGKILFLNQTSFFNICNSKLVNKNAFNAPWFFHGTISCLGPL